MGKKSSSSLRIGSVLNFEVGLKKKKNQKIFFSQIPFFCQFYIGTVFEINSHVHKK